MPARTRASARLGVTTVASGSSDVTNRSVASGSSSAVPVLERRTGSTTSRVGWLLRKSATATITSAESNAPVFAASTPISS
jgi:hypothetical protein